MSTEILNISDHRDAQSNIDKVDSIYSMLRLVEINPTELCNRRCSFCPRHDSKLYPNTNRHISVDTVKNLCISLKHINFDNIVTFVGFGEPLLHENIYDCIKVVRDMLPDLKWLEINTNGDLLDSKTLENLHTAGCSHIAVSMYDEDITSRLIEMRGDTPINFVFRHHYDKSNNYNLNIVNRSELLKGSTKNYFDTPCHIPFYKAMIDWNGDLLLCNNDWKRSKIYGNINEISFDKIWFGDELNAHRDKLMCSRSQCDPCKNCSVGGLLRGAESIEVYKEYHEEAH